MNEAGAERLADRRERADRVGVQRERARPVVLGPIDEIVRRGVEDAGRAQRVQRRAGRDGVEDVEVARAERRQLAGAIVEGPDEIGAQLTSGADDDIALAGRVAARRPPQRGDPVETASATRWSRCRMSNGLGM
jgi:hypothetical protein